VINQPTERNIPDPTILGIDDIKYVKIADNCSKNNGGKRAKKGNLEKVEKN